MSLTLDSFVDWVNPKRPVVHIGSIVRTGDHDFSCGELVANRSWVNLALYRTDPISGCMIVAQLR